MNFLKPTRPKIFAAIIFMIAMYLSVGFLFCGFSENDPMCNNSVAWLIVYVLGGPFFLGLLLDIEIESLILIVSIQIAWAYFLGCLSTYFLSYLYGKRNNMIIKIIVLFVILFLIFALVPDLVYTIQRL